MPFQFCPRCATPLQTVERGGRERPVCSACDFVHWNNPVPVVGAIVERDDHLILVQSIGWPEDWYALVTGFLEQNEDPDEAVLREVKEETGLDGTIESFVGMYPFFQRNQLLLVYHVRVPQGPVVLDETELAGYKEIPVTEVKPWAAGTGIALRDWLRARGIERELVPLPGRKDS